MSLIKRPTEILGKNTIAALIYGQSGMGKTTIACSAPAPVLFDFDGGVSRIRDEHQVPTVQITKWQDALDAVNEVAQSNEFRTIIIDTASKMMDSIIVHVCGTAQPSIKQWGLVNAQFKSFLRSVQSIGRNIVFVAQREVEKNGEEIRYIPAFRASNYKDVICDLDVCGYMEMVKYKGQEVRQLTFNPTSRNEGKNTAEFEPAYLIPTLAVGQPNTFLADRFSEYFTRQRERAERKIETAKAVTEKMQAYQQRFDACTDAMALNEVMQDICKEKPIGDLIVRLRMAVTTKAAQLQLTYNKESKLYE